MYRKFSDDLWSMAVNVANGPANQQQLNLPLVQPKRSWLGALVARLDESRRRIGQQIRAYRTYSETLQELSVLDDRQLADIGVQRAEIHQVGARQALRELQRAA